MMDRGAPPELVAVFADKDAENLVRGFIERGQERGCLRTFNWLPLRDSRRDAFAANPDRLLQPYLNTHGNFLLVWDHEGSGFSNSSPANVERAAVDALVRRNVPPEAIHAVAFVPEVEELLVPAWANVKRLLCAQRSVALPTDDSILKASGLASRFGELTVQKALAQHPKEMFLGLTRRVQLRFSSALFEGLGRELSLPEVKNSARASRLAEWLQRRFPPAPSAGAAMRVVPPSQGGHKRSVASRRRRTP